MKRVLFSVFVLTVLSMVSVGCQTAGKVDNKELQGEFANAPKWVFDASMEGGLSAVGSAKMSKAGMQFTKTEAMAAARNDLAMQMSVKVKTMVKNFTQATGIGDDEAVDRVSAQVSKQVAKQTLSGSRQKDTWISPSGEFFVLVVLDPAAVGDAVKESMKTSYKNEKALWQQFQAKKAQDELDAEIEKEFGEE